MEETSACSASRSVEFEESVNEESTTSLDTCNFCSQEVQTDSTSELHHKKVQTVVVELCTREVQTECNEFFTESNFCRMMQRYITTQGYQIVNFDCQFLNLS